MDPRESFFQNMLPYAKKASAELGIPSSVILAQWAHESAYGESYGAKHRLNFAGISNFIGKPYSWSKAIKVEPRPKSEGSWYNVYANASDFTDDYVHVMNLKYYDKVRAAGKTPGIDDDILQLAKSPFAADHYGGTGSNLMNIIKKFDLLKFDKNTIFGQEFGPIIDSNESLVNKDLGLVILSGAAALAFIALLDNI